jgi:hypothetical protein
VPIQYATYTLDGGIVSHLAYPALSFLIAAPAVLVTHGVQSVIAENVLFLTIELILVFLFLPRTYRALSVVVVLGLSFLFDYTLGGDIVTLSIPFMLVVAFRWTDIGAEKRLSRSDKVRAVCLGLAISISQITWFMVPFLVVGLLRLRTRQLGGREGSRVVLRFLLVAGAVAALVNAPFIAWAPGAWARDVLSPVLQHAIPFGQGLIDATAFFGIGGGNLAYYSYAAMCCLIALLALYSAFFDRLWRIGWILPSVVFLFSTRSLSEYVIMVVGIWIVSALAPGRGPGLKSGALSRRRRPLWGRLERVVLVGSTIAGLACIALAFSTPAPLKIMIRSVQTNGQFRSIWRIRAHVVNVSNTQLEPHFATDASGYMTTFWNVVRGPHALAPGREADYTLVAPNVGSMPGVTQPFVLQAVSASPQTISSSSLFTPEHFDTFISPSYVNHVLPLGKSVTLKVELRSPYGAPVRRSDVRVALGQIIYGQNTLIPGEAKINGAPQGQSPVLAETNAAGIATFHIRDQTAQDGNPLYFQAYVQPRGRFPYGYSEVVSVQWVPRNEVR